MAGNLHFKGTLEAADGVFSGALSAATGTFAGALQAATGTFTGALSAATGTFAGALQAATGTFSGSLSAASGTFTGSLVAASGNFNGIVRATDFQDPSGNSMLRNMGSGSRLDYKFTADYLELRGLTIRNSANLVTFQIDSNGNVSMQGNLTLGAGSYINWNQVNTDPATTAAANAASAAQTAANNAASSASNAENIARQIANGTFSGGTFIDRTRIYSPEIYANQLDIFPRTSGTTSGSFSLHGYVPAGGLMEAFRISYSFSGSPYVQFQSPNRSNANWSFPQTYFYNTINFAFGSTVRFSGATLDFFGATINNLNVVARVG
jgi:hypothetical protein